MSRRWERRRRSWKRRKKAGEVGEGVEVEEREEEGKEVVVVRISRKVVKGELDEKRK